MAVTVEISGGHSERRCGEIYGRSDVEPRRRTAIIGVRHRASGKHNRADQGQQELNFEEFQSVSVQLTRLPGSGGVQLGEQHPNRERTKT